MRGLEVLTFGAPQPARGCGVMSSSFLLIWETCVNDYGRLAYTGLGGLAIGGIFISQWWIALIALVVMGVAVTALRVGWRRGKSVDQP